MRARRADTGHDRLSAVELKTTAFPRSASRVAPPAARSFQPKECSNPTGRAIDVTCLVTGTLAGAVLGAFVQTGLGPCWVAWLSLFPILVVIRVAAPREALAYGALWGSVLVAITALLHRALPATELVPSDMSFLPVVLVSAGYVACGSLLTRSVGFQPVALAVGWILAELGLARLGLSHGAALSDQVDAPIYLLVAERCLGYAVVAGLAACVCACIVNTIVGVETNVGAAMPWHRGSDELRRAAPANRTWKPIEVALGSVLPRGPPPHGAGISDRWI